VLHKIRITFEKDKYSHYQQFSASKLMFDAQTYHNYFEKIGKMIFDDLTKVDTESFLKSFETVALMYHFDKKFLLSVNTKLEVKVFMDIQKLSET
jgi:hypothetical protein